MEVDRKRMFRRVFEYALRVGRYQGEGAMWGVERDEVVDGLIESGDYARVLKSEAFCRRFFPEPIVAVSGPPSQGVPFWNKLPKEPAWEPHHAAIQSSDDPLRYCWDFLAQRGAVEREG